MYDRDRCDIILGTTSNGDYIVDSRPEYHVGIFGPTGSMKTETTFYPTLTKGWRRSALIYCRKVAMMEKTIRERQKFSHCLIMDWTNENSICYNFFDAIPNNEQAIGRMQSLMAIMWDLDKGEFFDLAAFQLAVGAALHVLYCHENKSMGEVRRFITQGDDAIREMLDKQAHHLAVQAAQEISGPGGLVEKTAAQRAGIYSSVGTKLMMFDDPTVDRLTRTSEFTMADLMCADNPVSLYMILRKRDTKRLRPLARLFLDQLQGELMDDGDTVEESGKFRDKKHPLLIVGDEIDKLGHLEELSSAAGDMREPGLRLMLGTQGVSLLEELYGENGSMLINLRDKVFFRPDHPREVDRIAYWVGKTEEEQERVTESSKVFKLGPFNIRYGETGQSSSVTPVRKDVFPPERVMAMPDDQIVVSLGNQRILGKRMHSSSHPTWKKFLEPIKYADLKMRDVSGAYADLPRDPSKPIKSHWEGVDSTAPLNVAARARAKTL